MGKPWADTISETKSAAPERDADLHFFLERTTRFELATLTLARTRTLSARVQDVRFTWWIVRVVRTNPQSSAQIRERGLTR